MLTPQEIRALRKFMGMSPGRFGVEVGVSENAVRRWEIGDRHPWYKHMEKLVALLEQAKAKGFKMPKFAAVVKQTA